MNRPWNVRVSRDTCVQTRILGLSGAH